MIAYFLKRLVKHQAYGIKWLVLLFLGAFLLYGAWTDTASFLEDLEWSHYQESLLYREQLAFSQKAYAETEDLTTYEKLVFQQNLTIFSSGVEGYEAFQAGDYAASVGHELKRIRTTAEAYKIGNGAIPPGGGYFVSTVKQYDHFVTLREAYYRELLRHPEEIGKEEALNLSALDLFLHLTGYWKAKAADWLNLNSYLFLVPLLFSVGLVTRDRKVALLYRRMGYSNRTYTRDLFLANWCHAFLCQLVLCLGVFLPLGFRFGFGNPLVRLGFIWNGQLVDLPFWTAMASYVGLVLILDALLILLALLVELVLEELSAIAVTAVVLLAGLRLAFLRSDYLGKSYNPFYYLDSFRALNGWVNLTRQGLNLSFDRFLIGAGVVGGGVLVLLVLVLLVKERRGAYV